MTSKDKRSAATIKKEVDAVLRAPLKKEGGSSSSGIPSQAEYGRRELVAAHRILEEVRRMSLPDRKESQASFFEVMRGEPELVAERIGWRVDGNSGYGAMLLAKQVLASPRMNRSAALTQMIGSFEWSSPEDLSRAAWKKLSAGEKARLEREVQRVIADAEGAE